MKKTPKLTWTKWVNAEFYSAALAAVLAVVMFAIGVVVGWQTGVNQNAATAGQTLSQIQNSYHPANPNFGRYLNQ